ncbi:hypothetical protein N7517_000517 [Penicillium concentricum]|uniref:Uncharacterized protein n=1 Tax=Penicillium concentricum TaxID=293559 RepID=A0A9W9SQ55_9EURO|nr:uncharacterized protein N7517_000517 [Penicillium concentricum]KAJ5382606.1 hypothetical protein N7517_000517 [Penicillium concentricum]
MAESQIQEPDNSNWHEEDDVVVTDQSVGLPETRSYNLYNITPPSLREREDLHLWIDKIERILQGHNLHHLVNKNIPWPMRQSTNGQKWRTLSKRVRSWLSNSLDNKLMQEINSRGNPTDFADEPMEEINKHMKVETHGALKAAMSSFRTISRKQFSTSQEAAIPPYFAFQTMLLELMEVPELRSFIVVKDNEVYAVENPVQHVTIIDFYRYSSAIQDYIKFTNADSPGLVSSAVNNNGSNNNICHI